jgi:hypothetical protein
MKLMKLVNKNIEMLNKKSRKILLIRLTRSKIKSANRRIYLEMISIKNMKRY